MKTSIKLLTSLFLFLLLSFSVLGQSCNKTSRNITLNESSEISEIKINVQKNTKKTMIRVNSGIESGRLTIEVYDPNGSKQGYFSVESQIKSGDNKEEYVNGLMDKCFKNPIVGDWIVKLIPNKAKGHVAIDTTSSI